MSGSSTPKSPESCGQFVLRERIGRGGMGEIFLATGPDGSDVAIKRLLRECAKDPLFVGMFLDEARLVIKLQHSNICDVREHGQSGDHYFLAMEYIDGFTLRQLLDRRRGRGLPFPLASRIIAEVAAGLDYAHRLADGFGVPLEVVHRDVSPANIMLTHTGEVKVVDFGLAKARTQLMKTQPGLVKGKFGYLAPEQLGGHIDWRTDIFALGLCFYEALTGEQLFGQRTAAETVHAIKAFERPPPLADRLQIPASIDAILAQAMAPDPADRFESAAAMRAALGQAVVESGYDAVSAADLAQEVALTRSRPPGPGPTPPPEPVLAGTAADDLHGTLQGAAADALGARGLVGPRFWRMAAGGGVATLVAIALFLFLRGC